MIGLVRFQVGGNEAVATLGDDGVWSVTLDAPDAADLIRILTDDLNLNHSMDDYSPADGQPGYKLLHDAAKDWRGQVEAPPVPPIDPNLLY